MLPGGVRWQVVLTSLAVCSQLVVVAHAACVGAGQDVRCLEPLSEKEAKAKLAYVLAKYKEVEMMIPGGMVSVRGLRITHLDTEELNISFRYIDGAPHEIAQTCTFVLTRRPGSCETIATYCNPLISITPRPLLERETLDVCDDEAEASPGRK